MPSFARKILLPTYCMYSVVRTCKHGVLGTIHSLVRNNQPRPSMTNLTNVCTRFIQELVTSSDAANLGSQDLIDLADRSLRMRSVIDEAAGVGIPD